LHRAGISLNEIPGCDAFRDSIDFGHRLSKRIVLIDGEQLTALMIRHNVGCRIEDTLHIRKIDEDFFE